jgi:ABC-2 type transport system permease protein
VTGDVLTITRKDLREMLLQGGTLRRSMRSLLIMFVVFGVVLPLQIGPALVEQPVALLPFVVLALLLTSSMVADGIAGERERHTLETLLASRLSDRAILIGKIVAAIVYGCGSMFVGALVGLVTVNVAHAGGGILLYSPEALAMLAGFGVLGAGLVACGGSLVALRAPTVRQAVQNMNLAIIVLVFVPAFGFRALPEDVRSQLASTLAGLDWPTIAVGLAIAIGLFDLVLLAAATARFRRARLILDG